MKKVSASSLRNQLKVFLERMLEGIQYLVLNTKRGHILTPEKWYACVVEASFIMDSN